MKKEDDSIYDSKREIKVIGVIISVILLALLLGFVALDEIYLKIR